MKITKMTMLVSCMLVNFLLAEDTIPLMQSNSETALNKVDIDSVAEKGLNDSNDSSSLVTSLPSNDTKPANLRPYMDPQVSISFSAGTGLGFEFTIVGQSTVNKSLVGFAFGYLVDKYTDSTKYRQKIDSINTTTWTTSKKSAEIKNASSLIEIEEMKLIYMGLELAPNRNLHTMLGWAFGHGGFGPAIGISVIPVNRPVSPTISAKICRLKKSEVVYTEAIVAIGLSFGNRTPKTPK